MRLQVRKISSTKLETQRFQKTLLFITLQNIQQNERLLDKTCPVLDATIGGKMYPTTPSLKAMYKWTSLPNTAGCREAQFLHLKELQSQRLLTDRQAFYSYLGIKFFSMVKAM